MSVLGEMIRWLERDKGIVLNLEYRLKLLNLEATARDEGAVQGFADCEALILQMIRSFDPEKIKKVWKYVSTKDIEMILGQVELAISLGQHRTGVEP